MKQEFLYAVRETFTETDEGWEKYIEWSKLCHVTEIAGLDYILNCDLVKPGNQDENDWKKKYIPAHNDTGLYTTPDYVLSKIKTSGKFNFLAVVIEPTQNCNEIILENYDFMGYDLLDIYFEISALTNCGGFDESFSTSDINSVGLIDDFENAYNIANKLYENNPEEEHANTNVIGVWRHQFIGR